MVGSTLRRDRGGTFGKLAIAVESTGKGRQLRKRAINANIPMPLRRSVIENEFEDHYDFRNERRGRHWTGDRATMSSTARERVPDVHAGRAGARRRS